MKRPLIKEALKVQEEINEPYKRPQQQPKKSEDKSQFVEKCVISEKQPSNNYQDVLNQEKIEFNNSNQNTISKRSNSRKKRANTIEPYTRPQSQPKTGEEKSHFKQPKKVEEKSSVHNQKYIVVDTCIWINKLKEILEILTQPGYETHVIYVPWKVLQELDGLKKSENTTTQYNAREAIRAMLQAIIEKNNRFDGQTPLANDSAKDKYFEELKADHQIIKSCLLLKEQGKIFELYTFDDELVIEAVKSFDIKIFDKVFSSEEYKNRKTLVQFYKELMTTDKSNKRKRPTQEKFTEIMTKYYNAKPNQRKKVNSILQEY